MTRFARGLVVGKFCPLHCGHQLILDRATAECAELLIVSYTGPGFERCGIGARDGWLAHLYPDATRLVLDDESLGERCRRQRVAVRTLPPDDAAADEHREFVAWLCTTFVGGPVDAVFTSESYGPGFAAHLARAFGREVRHVAVDPERTAVPGSGTAIRADVPAHAHLLPPVVRASLTRRVCVLGGESTGKTTLAQGLAQARGTGWVPEYGRELWERRGGLLTFDDMLHIAETQIDMEAAMVSAGGLLVCDTSPLTTLFYSEAMFGRADPRLSALAERRYDLALLCAPDFAFVQDGTRRDEAFRQRQHAWYEEALAARGWPWREISGPPPSRLASALELTAPLTTLAALRSSTAPAPVRSFA